MSDRVKEYERGSLQVAPLTCLPSMHMIPHLPKTGLPWRTFLVAATALAIASSPALTSALTATRENAAQLWPLLTGHLCHWTGSHLFWDLLVFIIAGSMVERRLGRAFLPCLGLVGSAIASIVFLLMPGIGSYRGLSGIDTFLYTFAVLGLIREAYPGFPHNWRALTYAPLLLLFCKIGFEIATGEALFSGPLGEGVLPLPLAHAAGALLGIVSGCSSPKKPKILDLQGRNPKQNARFSSISISLSSIYDQENCLSRHHRSNLQSPRGFRRRIVLHRHS